MISNIANNDGKKASSWLDHYQIEENDLKDKPVFLDEDLKMKMPGKSYDFTAAKEQPNNRI